MCIHVCIAPNTSVNEESVETTWFGNSLIISWEPLTLHEARGFPVYYIYLNDSSGPVKREIEPTANTTESSIVIDGLDSTKSHNIRIGVATGGGQYVGTLSEPGMYYNIYSYLCTLMVCIYRIFIYLSIFSSKY